MAQPEVSRDGFPAREPRQGLEMRFRFSIATMMAAILVIGLSFAALTINSGLYGGIILLTTLALLCSAILMRHFTIQRLMLAIAVVAVVLGGFIGLARMAGRPSTAAVYSPRAHCASNTIPATCWGV
jgi:hypothetical protein